MTKPVDLNLLTSLDALLSERSVTGAARRLGLSPSAMSRTLARLRAATGDALLVPAGRTLVATPYGEQLRVRVHELAGDARAVLQPAGNTLDMAALQRTFSIRANEAFIDLAGPGLMRWVADTAPGVRIQFVPKADKEAGALREGVVDLEVGVIGTKAPELKTRLLFHDRFVGVCREGHPLLKKPGVTVQRYAACAHVVASRRKVCRGPVDAALEKLGLRRNITMVVPTFANALRIVRHTDLIGQVPHACLGDASPGGNATNAGIRHFELPVRTPPVKVSALWHPRWQADPAHRWLRETVFAICAEARSGG